MGQVLSALHQVGEALLEKSALLHVGVGLCERIYSRGLDSYNMNRIRIISLKAATTGLSAMDHGCRTVRVVGQDGFPIAHSRATLAHSSVPTRTLPLAHSHGPTRSLARSHSLTRTVPLAHSHGPTRSLARSHSLTRTLSLAHSLVFHSRGNKVGYKAIYDLILFPSYLISARVENERVSEWERASERVGACE